MRTIQSTRAGWLAGLLGACVLFAGAARADVSTERPGSILIFPKVVNDGSRTTIIQITNTGNMPNQLRCFFLNGATGRTGAPLCTETDFDIFLTQQQPIEFDVSRGIGLTDMTGGLLPNLIPPVAPGFTGALLCVEVDTSGTPSPQNKLKGEATIVATVGGDESKYNGVAVSKGLGTNSGDNVLKLDGSEYNACPAALRANFIPPGAPNPVIEELGNGGLCGNTGVPCNTGADCAVCESNGVCLGTTTTCTLDSQCVAVAPTCTTGLSRVASTLTLVPCNLDIETGFITPVSIFLSANNEFEQHLSASIPALSCFGSFDLGALGLTSASLFGAQFATVLITPSSPVVGVLESLHIDSIAHSASAAVNLHMQGSCNALSTNAGALCNSDADCIGAAAGAKCTGPATEIRIPLE